MTESIKNKTALLPKTKQLHIQRQLFGSGTQRAVDAFVTVKVRHYAVYLVINVPSTLSQLPQQNNDANLSGPSSKLSLLIE